jgi:hypothetical protein
MGDTKELKMELEQAQILMIQGEVIRSIETMSHGCDVCRFEIRDHSKAI